MSVPVDDILIVNAVVTRSKARHSRHGEITQMDRPPNTWPEATDSSQAHGNSSTVRSWSQSFSRNAFEFRQIQVEQSKDPIIHDLIAKIQQQGPIASFMLNEGVLCKVQTQSPHVDGEKELIYVPSSMIDPLLKIYHDDPLSGHFGIIRTYFKLKKKFWWPGVKDSVVRYVKACLLCQQYNVSRIKKPGYLYPIDPPEGPFQMIGIDYCGPFKRTPRKNQYVLCITDYFTRWIIAIALPNCSAKTTAETIFSGYICRYGVPVTLLSDKGTHFNNQLMDTMTKLVGFNHVFSTVYHPQSNGLVERFNVTFVPQLAKLHNRENNNWDEYLSPVVFAYNSGTHATTGSSPFQLQLDEKLVYPLINLRRFMSSICRWIITVN